MTATGSHRSPAPSARIAARLAPALVAVAVLPLGGILGAGSAAAADKPVVGTAACSAAVEHSASVQSARARLDRLQATDNTAASRLASASNELAAAQQALNGVHPGEPGYAGARERYEEAKSAVTKATAEKRSADAALSPAVTAVAQARSSAQGQLCRPAGSDPTPTPLPPGNPGLPHEPHPAGDECSEVRKDEKAVDSAQADTNGAHRTAEQAVADLRTDLDHHASQDVIERDKARVRATAERARHTDDALHRAQEALHQALLRAQEAGAPCGSDQDPGGHGGGSGDPGDGSVDPDGDDGSSAAVSGSQVTDVPVGSAQTGEA